MTVTTSRGKTFPVDWMWGPVGPAAELMLQLRDERPLSEIAADFEGCERFLRQSETEGDMTFEGYAALTVLARPAYADPAVVQLTLAIPERS